MQDSSFFFWNQSKTKLGISGSPSPFVDEVCGAVALFKGKERKAMAHASLKKRDADAIEFGSNQAVVKQIPTPFPGAKPAIQKQALKAGGGRFPWKFVDRAEEETEAFLTSLLDMCHVNGEPRIDALEALFQLLTEKPPKSARACVSLVSLNGLSTMVSVLGVSCSESRHRASKILQEAVAFGHGDKVCECRSLLFQLKRNLASDQPWTRVSGAALLRVVKPTPDSVSIIEPLLTCLKHEMVQVREESAGALAQLTSEKICAEEMYNGTLIEDLVLQFMSSGSLAVRKHCSAVLAALARTSSKHRTKIVNNGAVEAMLESLNPTFPEEIIDNVLVALQRLCVEERARKTFVRLGLVDKVAHIISGDAGFETAARRQAFSVLDALNKTPQGAPRQPFFCIGDLTSEQDCTGLAQLFSLLPTTFICWRIRRVSRCWRKVTGMPGSLLSSSHAQYRWSAIQDELTLISENSIRNLAAC